MTGRFYARFAHSPNHYIVVDSKENCTLGDPKPYHEANDEAGERNRGTWGAKAATDTTVVPAPGQWLTI